MVGSISVTGGANNHTIIRKNLQKYNFGFFFNLKLVKVYHSHEGQFVIPSFAKVCKNEVLAFF